MFYDAVRNDHGFQSIPSRPSWCRGPSAGYPRFRQAAWPTWRPSAISTPSPRPRITWLSASATRKDTLRNVEATGEFAVNLATWDLREQMNATSAHVGPEVDEFELAGLAKAPCRMIAPSRVAASPACLECRLFQLVPLPDDAGHAAEHMVIGRVVGIHIDDRYIQRRPRRYRGHAPHRPAGL